MEAAETDGANLALLNLTLTQGKAQRHCGTGVARLLKN